MTINNATPEPATKRRSSKTTKGLIAAGAAALLLGGAGTLAYWTDSGTVTGGTIGTGTMDITTPNCGTGWTYDAGEVLAGATFTPGTSKLVPGDSISETCTTTFTGTGEHLRATIAASAGTGTNLFTAAAPNNLTLTQGGLEVSSDGGTTWAPVSSLTEQNNGNLVRIAVTVSFNPLADNTTMNVDSALSDITITANQIHS